MTTRMTLEECRAFLSEPHVAIISVAESGRGPLSVPVWYLSDPNGELRVWMSPDTRKARLIQKAGRFSLVVQDPNPPYKYVSVEGPVVTVEPAQLERDIRPMAHRYLGVEPGERYIKSIGGASAGQGDILIRMRPERWLSVDYSKLGPLG
ncbi:MAG TPA: pyridoxamine 5'-phosphate oxidase family protein [Anaerolineales bacterium]|nr:pyridoxamine 5'-phosphate oxidase family protein [Anaerolineales bacterium]